MRTDRLIGRVGIGLQSLPMESARSAAQLLLEWLAGIAESSGVLPGSAHAIVGLGVIAGLTLWGMGIRVVKPVLAGMGLLLGAGCGFLLIPLAAPNTIADIDSAYVGMVIGAFIGLLAAIALFRVAIGVAAACVCSILAVLVAGLSLEFTPDPSEATAAETPGETLQPTPLAPTDPETGEPAEGAPGEREDPAPNDRPAITDPDVTPDQFLPGLRPRDGGIDPGLRNELVPDEFLEPLRDDAVAVLRSAAERAVAFMGEFRQETAEHWRQLPGEHRLLLGAASLGGAAFGLLIGVLMPKRSSALVTALAGAGVWLAGVTWLTKAYDLPSSDFLLTRTPIQWMIIWGAAGMLGLIIQLQSLARRKRKKKNGD